MTGDIRDRGSIRSAVRQVKPEVVIHLAGQASVKSSFDDPLDTFSANVAGTTVLLEALRVEAPHANVVAVGSAEAYGTIDPSRLPVREDAPLAPNNPYAASKAAAEMVALQYARAGWLRVVVTRSFNHTG